MRIIAGDRITQLRYRNLLSFHNRYVDKEGLTELESVNNMGLLYLETFDMELEHSALAMELLW